MIPYKADPQRTRGYCGYSYWRERILREDAHGISGGCKDVGPMRLDTAGMVAKEQIDAYVAIHKQFQGGSK